jgi:hypothetical protein
MKPNRTRLQTQLAVRHVRSIRAGVAAMYDVNQILDAWFANQNPIDNSMKNEPVAIADQMARDWVRIHATKVDTERLNSALARVYADGWVLGDSVTLYELARAVGLRKAAPSKKDLSNALQTDWRNWKPGNQAAARLVKPPNGLKRLLDGRGVKIQGMGSTTLNRIGTALADGLRAGSTRREVARAIDEIINDPERALTIAGTEMSSAVVQASYDMYRESGVEQVEWLVADPCDDCQENLDQSPIGIDDSWINGDPPVHPNCMCDVAPYVVDTGLWDWLNTPEEE